MRQVLSPACVWWRRQEGLPAFAVLPSLRWKCLREYGVWSKWTKSSDTLPISYFSIAVIQHCDQRQHKERRAYLGLRFQKESPWLQGRCGSTELEQETERPCLQPYIGSSQIWKRAQVPNPQTPGWWVIHFPSKSLVTKCSNMRAMRGISHPKSPQVLKNLCIWKKKKDTHEVDNHTNALLAGPF